MASAPTTTLAMEPAAATKRLLVPVCSATVERDSARTPVRAHARPWPSTSCAMSQAAYATVPTAITVQRLAGAELGCEGSLIRVPAQDAPATFRVDPPRSFEGNLPSTNPSR